MGGVPVLFGSRREEGQEEEVADGERGGGFGKLACTRSTRGTRRKRTYGWIRKRGTVPRLLLPCHREQPDADVQDGAVPDSLTTQTLVEYRENRNACLGEKSYVLGFQLLEILGFWLHIGTSLVLVHQLTQFVCSSRANKGCRHVDVFENLGFYEICTLVLKSEGFCVLILSLKLKITFFLFNL